MKISSRILSFLLALMLVIALWTLVNYSSKPVSAPSSVLILDDRILDMDDPYFIENNRIYLKTQVFDTMGINYTLESSDARLIINIKSGGVAYEDAPLTQQITSQAENINFPLKSLNTGYYIELERLSDWLGIRSTLTADQKILMLDSKGDRISGIVSPEGSAFYTLPGNKGVRNRDLKEGEKLRLFSENGEEYRLRTMDGLIGYGLKSAIISYPEKTGLDENFTKRRNAPKQYGPINITFEYVSRYSANPDISSESKIQGLDVLCPTWFTLNEDSGVVNDASIRYSRDAHALGYRVWGVFRNGFEPDRTHLLLTDEGIRDRAIAKIAFYSSFYELDGINIDFENVYKKDQALLTEFLKQLDGALTRQGVTLSVDAAPPWGSDQWSLFLDRSEVARIADYVILMAYDEHYASSPVSGSVASLGWTEKAVMESLELIPDEKLLLGVPLYTRVWSETPDGAGGVTVSSKAIGMKDQDALLLDKAPEYLFDDRSGQMTASYVEEGTVKMIWMEDDASIQARLQLINKYNLAGIASWRRGFEKETFWTLVRENLKGQ